MKVDYTKSALVALRDAPPKVRKAVYKQVKFLQQNLHHPSLRAKKFDETENIWQARVNKDWRFYFKIEHDTYIVIKIIRHPK